MRSRVWRSSRPQETAGRVSGVQTSNRLPNQHDWLFDLPVRPLLSFIFSIYSHSIHLFLHLVVSLLCSSKSNHSSNLESASLSILPSIRAPFAPRGWKVWWYFASFCRRHVRRHVRSILEEDEVICTELQAERQDVYSGTKGCHVSSYFALPLDFVLLAPSSDVRLVSDVHFLLLNV